MRSERITPVVVLAGAPPRRSLAQNPRQLSRFEPGPCFLVIVFSSSRKRADHYGSRRQRRVGVIGAESIRAGDGTDRCHGSFRR